MSKYEPWEVPGFFETKEHQEERLRNAVCCDNCGREMHMVVSYIPGIPDPQHDVYKCEHCGCFKRKEKKMKEEVLCHWTKNSEGYWYVDKANYPSKLSSGEMLEYTESEKAFREDWDKKLLDRLIAKERKSKDYDFWTLRRDDGKYLIQTPTPTPFPGFGIEDEFTDDVMLASRFTTKQLAEQLIKSFENRQHMKWPAEIVLHDALTLCKPVHVKMQIVYEVGEE